MEKVLDYIDQMTVEDKMQLLGMLKAEVSLNTTVPNLV